MIHPNDNAHPDAPRSQLTGRILVAALLATGAALNACERGEPVGPDRVAPERPSLALNPACDPGLGGQTHTDSVLAPETWNRAANPHRVNQVIYIHGAGVLTLQPGVLVCFGSAAALGAVSGGRLVADGLDTARIVLTAADADSGWWGVHMQGSPATGSSLRNVRMEHTRLVYSLSTNDDHAATIDSVVFRQIEHGLHLWGRGTSIRRSRLDTVTSAAVPAVALGNLITFEKTTIRGAAGVGLAVLGTSGVSLLGGRIEGSGGVGLQAKTIAGPGFTATQPVRMVGGASYPAELSVGAFGRIYPGASQQDSLLGNARDTLVVTGGDLHAYAYPSYRLPWRVTGDIHVKYFGILGGGPGASVTFDAGRGVTATDGGRLAIRGTAAAPAVFTGSYWSGFDLSETPPYGSYMTNVRVEGVTGGIAMIAYHPHPLVIDSAVFRQNGQAVILLAEGSRMSRSRVDTTRFQGYAAVDISHNTIIESTLIRGSGGIGLRVRSHEAQVLSCEIRDNAENGIETWLGAAVHNCNLINNGGVGIRAYNGWTVNGEDNWWGDAAGPAGPSGDGVSTDVDYTPWRTTPYVLPYVP